MTSRWLRASRATLSIMPFVCEYVPVKNAARDGEHSGVLAKALRKFAPSRAKRSACGVEAKG